MSSLQVQAGIYYKRVCLREVCIIRDRAGACRHSAKKEKQQISVIRVSGACLALDGGRSRRWNEKKTVTGAATDDSAERDTVTMATAASPDEVTRWCICARWCLTASLFSANCSRQRPASSDIIACVFEFLNSCSIKNGPLAHLKCGYFFPRWDVDTSECGNGMDDIFRPQKIWHYLLNTSCHSNPFSLPLFGETQN